MPVLTSTVGRRLVPHQRAGGLVGGIIRRIDAVYCYRHVAVRKREALVARRHGNRAVDDDIGADRSVDRCPQSGAIDG